MALGARPPPLEYTPSAKEDAGSLQSPANRLRVCASDISESTGPEHGLFEAVDFRGDRGFDVCWQVIRAMFSAWPEEKRRAFEVSLPAYAAAVARVSGGLLGFWAISAEERTALQRVAREITEAHAEAARTIAEKASIAHS
jgi:hypothetical protein